MSRRDVVLLEFAGLALVAAGLGWRFHWWGLIGAGLAFCAVALLANYDDERKG